MVTTLYAPCDPNVRISRLSGLGDSGAGARTGRWSPDAGVRQRLPHVRSVRKRGPFPEPGQGPFLDQPPYCARPDSA